jgi:antitoxin (DNA-binding transcriptional repressor) of toxin-antitoxin stability system
MIALTSSSRFLYIVHMKSVNASEARKNWFRLLDEALRGEVIVVQRKGRRLVLRREELNDKKIGVKTRQYKKLLRVPKAGEADRWSWEWKGPAGGLVARRRAAR